MSCLCPDCDLSELMPDGTLFCVVLEAQVHGDQACEEWTSSPDLLDDFDWEDLDFDEEDW